MSQQNKLTARRFFEEIYTRGRFDLLEELVSPDYVAAGAARARVGHAGIKESLSRRPSDLRAVVEEQFAEGDTVITRLSILQGGVWSDAVAIQRFAGGKLVETWRIAKPRD